MDNILDLSSAPKDSVARLLFLSGVREKMLAELDDAFGETYSDLRLSGRFNWALSVGLHSKHKALALTRRWNKAQGRMIRWGDKIDPSSTQYEG